MNDYFSSSPKRVHNWKMFFQHLKSLRNMLRDSFHEISIRFVDTYSLERKSPTSYCCATWTRISVITYFAPENIEARNLEMQRDANLIKTTKAPKPCAFNYRDIKFPCFALNSLIGIASNVFIFHSWSFSFTTSLRTRVPREKMKEMLNVERGSNEH